MFSVMRASVTGRRGRWRRCALGSLFGLHELFIDHLNRAQTLTAIPPTRRLCSGLP